ncbi:hypothetical protein VP01_510g12 [Puccinia sorghi]|uniref:Uncharacterized protein n=1 Tax=Puccinia sorghi TaxID=27349 RepID=A0A0L6UN61_9BASI|nr:hypothetical protein VP01_510g12 [Puccinia sorghi]
MTLHAVRVVNLLDLLKIKIAIFSEDAVLTSSEELILRTVLAAKIDATIHSNVINHTNKEDGMLIWKSINNYFASTQSAHHINGFITRTRAAIEKMHEVGINIDTDVVGYEIIKKFPNTPELNSSSAITHSGQEMTPDLVLDHLRLHANKQSISGNKLSSQQVSLFTDYNSTKCKPNAHNTRAPHPQHRCWMLHPHLRPNSSNPARAEQSVSSFHSSISHPSMNFVLDSGSSAHMISNLNLFFSIDIKEEGIVRTSSGAKSLKIKGIGSIKLSNSYGDIFLHKVLYIPNICVNILSVLCLVLEGYQIAFEMNSFLIKKNNKLCMYGRYVNNLPTLEFSNPENDSLFSSGELIHKALGHVSYKRIRQRLGIPMNNCRPCDACAVSKVTRGSFHSRHSKASKPFEEIHLDIVGHITPSSCQGHQYFLTIVDSCTRFCSAIPLKNKSEVVIIKASTLTLNQIPAHKSKKSPFELFKNCSLPLNYFKPIGLKVSYLYLPDNFNSKLAQIGGLGTLVGYNEELRSYRVATETGKVINSKHLKFLDFPASDEKTSDLDINDDWTEHELNMMGSEPEKENSEALTLEEGDSTNPKVSRQESESDSEAEDEDVIEKTLVPEARTLRDRNSKIKPIKYSYLTGDPDSYQIAMKSVNRKQWAAAADEEFSNIEGHDVWEDQWEEPSSFLRTVWIFKTKPQTLSAAEKKKGRLCIQGFSQIPGVDYDNTFAPTGKFTSLLILLIKSVH